MLNCDQYLMPATLKDALALLARAPEGSRLIAGATDILPWAREGRAGDVHLPALIDVSRVKELDGWSIENGKVRLGANAVLQQFLTEDVLRRNLPCMPYCAVWFADDQIREQATVAGNLVNASPAADTTPAILTLNGEVQLARLDGETVATRTMPVSAFILGPGRTDLKPDEIVTAITCDALPGYGGSFEKVGQRRSLVISVACAACLVKVEAGKFADLRIALAGVGPLPQRLHHVEKALIDNPVSADLIHEVAQMTDGLINSRSRRAYRKAVVEGFIERAIVNALADCGHTLADAPVLEAADA